MKRIIVKLSGYTITILLLIVLPSIDAYCVSTTEREALIAIYNSTDGPNWTNNEGWLGDVGTECTWYGVGCENNNLTSLALDSNNLTGIIPPGIGSLINLNVLSLEQNGLTGSIPPGIGSLINLHTLNLRNNGLTGSIPPEIGSLTNLQYLFFGYNGLTGNIPPEIGSLINLKELRLEGNQLFGSIPPSFSELIFLTYFNIEGNCLTDFEPVNHVPNLIGVYAQSNTCDSDNDGLINNEEGLIYLTDPLNSDTDGDGLVDGIEVEYWGADWNTDLDNDLLVNLLDPDSDNDTLNDGFEVNILGTNPALADGNIDTDADGFTNAQEIRCGSDPVDANSKCIPVSQWLMLLLD